MLKKLGYTRYHVYFKILTFIIMITLSFTTIENWDIKNAGVILGFTMLFNLIVLGIRKFFYFDFIPFITLKIAGNFILWNLFLYYTAGAQNLSYIPFYFFMIVTITGYFGIRAGILCGILCTVLSFQGFAGSLNSIYRILHHIYIYGMAVAIGYFVRTEGVRNLELDNKVKELRALYKISKIIDQFPDTQKILDNITRIVAETMNYASSVIMFYDEEKNKLVAKSSWGMCKDMLGRLSFPPGEGLERRLIDHPQEIMIYDSLKEGTLEFKKEKDGKPVCTVGYAAAVPLYLKNKVIGTLSIYDEKYKPLTAEDRELLYMMSSRIGVILENDLLYKQVKNRSITDGLTGLYNHKQFYERLKFEIENAKRDHATLFLLMIDIDQFKKFNDCYGHLVGDKVLVEMAKTIKNSIRETDVAARYGGEEFAIILTQATYETAAIVADRIRYNVKRITKNIEELRDKEVEITVSIGIACYPKCTDDISNLIDIADIRMYKGKELGGDKVIA